MIIDTNHRTTNALGKLKQEGVQTIIKYYAIKTNQPEKLLTRSEAEAIIAAGMSIAVVYQAAGNSSSCFSSQIGSDDAQYARTYAAKTIGQPEGSAIYFGVDYDCQQHELTTCVTPYFDAVRTAFTRDNGEPRYKVGVYGNGLIASNLLDKGLVDYTWISNSRKFTGTPDFTQSNRWTLLQHLPSKHGGLDCDVDDLNPSCTQFGAFNTLNPVQRSFYQRAVDWWKG
jgi:hypothetical protein